MQQEHPNKANDKHNANAFIHNARQHKHATIWTTTSIHNANGHGIHNAINHMEYTMLDGLKPKWTDLSHAQISGHNTKTKASKGKTHMHTYWSTSKATRTQPLGALKGWQKWEHGKSICSKITCKVKPYHANSSNKACQETWNTKLVKGFTLQAYQAMLKWPKALKTDLM